MASGEDLRAATDRETGRGATVSSPGSVPKLVDRAQRLVDPRAPEPTRNERVLKWVRARAGRELRRSS